MVSSGVPLTGIVNVAAGTDESFAVDSSGNVWAWGYNPNGQLGIATTSNALYAVQITTLSNMIGIASNQYHTLALQANGSVWSWGANSSGQVGNGATASYVTQPTEVVATTGQSGYLKGIVAVAAGASHSLALDNTGKVWAWGLDSSGQLGDADSTLTSQSSPVSVLKNGTALINVIGMAANATNSFAFRNDGTVYAWGDNSTGELGTGAITSSLSAIQVSGLSTMAAVTNEAALDPNGIVWTWGTNNNGQLGIGYTGYYATLPLAVNPLATSSPTLTTTAGNGQTVTDGTFSSPFTISASSGQGTWVNMIVNPTGGFLGLTSGATQLSPIIGGYTNSSGQISFYLQPPANGTGTVPLTTTSGASLLSGITAIEQAAQSIASTGEPTMPQWGLIIMAALLIWVASRHKARLA
jgi:alpha-tubulin suppressor-like RCC1 family protein